MHKKGEKRGKVERSGARYERYDERKYQETDTNEATLGCGKKMVFHEKIR